MGNSRKPRAGHSVAAFSRLELVVVIGFMAVLALFFLAPTSSLTKLKVQRISCINNLKQIGTACRLSADDNGGKLPAEWSSLLATSNAGRNCWRLYTFVSNSPSVLVCPADERRPTMDFSHISNKSISYFVGVGASDTYRQSILGGDRNLGPGTVPDRNYGYSPANGQGNDVVVAGPVCWSLKMHSHGATTGAGNILLADGSAQQVTSWALTHEWLTNAMVPLKGATGLTNAMGMRLVFP